MTMEPLEKLYSLLAPLNKRYGEDIVQEALTRTLEQAPEVYEKPPIEFLKYVTRACRNLRYTQHRDEALRANRRERYLRPPQSTPDIAQEVELKPWLNQATAIRTKPMHRMRRKRELRQLYRCYRSET